MAKKRKSGRASGASRTARKDVAVDPEDHFNDSEDEFHAGRDKILLDEEPAAKRQRRLQEQEADIEASDEEVFRDASSENEWSGEDGSGASDQDCPEQADDEDDEAEDGYWGTSRRDYFDADAIETEADALEEEAEAKRLQQKQLKSMTDADFGFDESAWLAETPQAKKSRRPAVEKLPEALIPEGATTQDLDRIFKNKYPEFLPLTEDYLALQKEYAACKDNFEDKERCSALSQIKFVAMSAYFAAITMYMALLSSGGPGLPLSPDELHNHAIMTAILQSRKQWLRTRDLEESAPRISSPKPVAVADDTPSQTPRGRSRKPRPVTVPSVSSPAPLENKLPEKKSRKPRTTRRNELQNLLDASLQETVEDASDFGDEVPLTQAEAEEKAKKKRSLRFYTSQIAQKANKRGAASRQAGGDDDLPHKERLRDRQDRLMREAEQRGRAAALDTEALDEDDNDLAAVQQNHDEADDYYNSLVAQSKQKKSDKQARAAVYAEAAKEGAQVFEEEQVGPDGKRKITYAIEKNKGLAPKRKKDVRNPRVKKRKKYDEKLKKLSSIRQVYKGGEGRGGYGGEATGIKTNLVKSTKL